MTHRDLAGNAGVAIGAMSALLLVLTAILVLGIEDWKVAAIALLAFLSGGGMGIAAILFHIADGE